MSTHRFEIEVEVDNWPADVPVYAGDPGQRQPEDLAEQAAWEGGIWEANRKDGWADFPEGVSARITGVLPL